MFQYNNLLGRTYDLSSRIVKSITFNISFLGNYNHTIIFTPAVSEFEAIRAAENYLSQPITLSHYELIKDDLPVETENYTESQTWLKTKGDALSIAKHISKITYDKSKENIIILSQL